MIERQGPRDPIQNISPSKGVIDRELRRDWPDAVAGKLKHIRGDVVEKYPKK
jgi:hypothetical protein